ncbi:MAG: futalosine hydrolase [Actinomycetia bacterium]|nr:futalosine hydrolase [Actinomycetes bacterium]
MSILIITAVPAERDAILAAVIDPEIEVAVGGVGPAAAAAATAAALAATPAGERPELVLSAGIGGGFGAVPVGGIAVATQIVFADLGAETPDGFRPLGLDTERYPVDRDLARRLAVATGGFAGAILTVATVTGTTASADRLLRAHPDAVAEGMEGAGVAAAAQLHDIPFGELRAISNRVGPRQREQWRIPEALIALGGAAAALVSSPWRIAP